MTTPSEHPRTDGEGQGDTAALQTLEHLLETAVRLADASGLTFPAIRIEQALMLVRAQSGSAPAPHREGIPPWLN